MDARFFDSLYEGDSANGTKLGMGLTGGEFWPRVDGCYILYRGQDGIIDHDNITAVMDGDDNQIAVSNQSLSPNTTWHYIRREASGCGLESPDSPPCIVVIDANGDMLGDVPNTPDPVSVEQLAGGKLRVRWRYPQIGQDVEPTGFKVYMDSGSGFDFDTPAATIAYRPWLAGEFSSEGMGGLNESVAIMQGVSGEFFWTSGELVDGQLYKFCVRAYRSGEGETQNTDYVSAYADATGPDAAANLIASWQEVPD